MIDTLKELYKFTGIMPVEESLKEDTSISDEEIFDRLESLMKLGFLPNRIEILKLPNQTFQKVLKFVEEISGSNIDWDNTTFYGLFSDVKRMTDDELRYHQILHYMTTYLIPYLINGNVNKLVIEPYLPPRIQRHLEKINDIDTKLLKTLDVRLLSEVLDIFLNTIVYGSRPLNETQLETVVEIIRAFKIQVDLKNIVNKELKVKLMDEGLAEPEDADEVLRYIVYKIADTTMIVNSKWFKENLKQHRLNPNLRRKFFYLIAKTIHNETFLPSYKSRRKIWKIILRKIKPEKYLKLDPKAADIMLHADKLIKHIKTHNRLINDFIDGKRDSLEGVPISLIARRFTEIVDKREIDDSIINRMQLKHLVSIYSSIIQRKLTDTHSVFIRTGNIHTLTKESKPSYFNKDLTVYIPRIQQAIYDKVQKNLEKLGIEYVNQVDIHPLIKHALPTTDRFSAVPSLPSYSMIDLSNVEYKHLICGVHWVDDDDGRSDLDLSAIKFNVDGSVSYVSWNTRFKRDGMLHTGDRTEAPPPQGASELIYVENAKSPSIEGVLFDVRVFYSSFDTVNARFIVIPTNVDYQHHEEVSMVDLSRAIVNLELTFSRQITSFQTLLAGDKIYILPMSKRTPVMITKSLEPSKELHDVLSRCLSMIHLEDILYEILPESQEEYEEKVPIQDIVNALKAV